MFDMFALVVVELLKLQGIAVEIGKHGLDAQLHVEAGVAGA